MYLSSIVIGHANYRYIGVMYKYVSMQSLDMSIDLSDILTTMD